MRPRPWSGWGDLPRLQAIAAEGTRDAPERGYVHPGDVAWWLGWHPRRTIPDAAIAIVEDGGRVAGWVLDDDGDVREYVDPTLLDTPGHDAFAAVVDAWLAARGGRHDRWADDTDVAAIARLIEAGYVRTDDGTWCFERDELGAPPDAGDVRPVATDDDVRARATVTFAAFSNPPPFDAYLRAYRGFVASPAYPAGWDLVCRTPVGEPAACCIAWPDPVSGRGNFEPVGTHPGRQRQGYGRVVMAEGLRRLATAGMSGAIVRTTVGNLPAEGLYRSLGFTLRRTWHTYRRAPGDG